MAETSGLWTTSGAPAGHQVASYTQALATDMLAITAACSGFEGVAPGYLNELAPSSTGVNNCRIATGGAMVDGKYYKNSANVDVNIPSSSGGNTRIDRVVLRATWADFDCVIERIPGTDDPAPTAPAITQTSGTTYDIQLCQVLVTAGGVITITDERKWAVVDTDESTLEDSAGLLRVKDLGITTAKINDLAVTTGKIAADAVTNAKIADDQIDSEHYVDGSIDLAHMSANSIDSDQYVDGSIDTIHLSNDAVDDTKAGNRVPQFYRRQGGSATSWISVGTTTYTPTSVRMQAGSTEWTGGSATTGNEAVTFPTAFSDVPLVWVQVVNYTDVFAAPTSISLSANGFTITWEAGAKTAIMFFWLAIGPE
jgi:hypothetical protein